MPLSSQKIEMIYPVMPDRLYQTTYFSPFTEVHESWKGGVWKVSIPACIYVIKDQARQNIGENFLTWLGHGSEITILEMHGLNESFIETYTQPTWKDIYNAESAAEFEHAFGAAWFLLTSQLVEPKEMRQSLKAIRAIVKATN